MRGLSSALALAMGVAATGAVAQTRCPAELTVNEQPQAPPGYRADSATSTRPFLRLSVFDGVPSENVNLAPARESRDGTARVQTFELPEPRQRPAVMVCRYLDTAATVSVVLPTTVKRCTFRFVYNEAAKRIDTGRVKPQASCG
ncbi:MAG: hypothetical protein FJX57_12145 [Alphaproteobacteria bacterium]|nr:hypothetical protein [Alphaproteobacteria bacterium]